MRDALVKIVVVFARYRYAMLCYVMLYVVAENLMTVDFDLDFDLEKLISNDISIPDIIFHFVFFPYFLHLLSNFLFYYDFNLNKS